MQSGLTRQLANDFISVLTKGQGLARITTEMVDWVGHDIHDAWRAERHRRSMVHPI